MKMIQSVKAIQYRPLKVIPLYFYRRDKCKTDSGSIWFDLNQKIVWLESDGTTAQFGRIESDSRYRDSMKCFSGAVISGACSIAVERGFFGRKWTIHEQGRVVYEGPEDGLNDSLRTSWGGYFAGDAKEETVSYFAPSENSARPINYVVASLLLFAGMNDEP